MSVQARAKSMATVQLKYGERVLKLRPQSMNIANLAMIFKLDANEGVYLTSEEGEIIFVPMK